MDERIIWQYRKLGEFAELVKGRTPPRENMAYYSDKGMPWVKLENLKRRVVTASQEYLSLEGEAYGRTVPKDAVLLSINRTIGKVGIAGVPLQTNEQLAAIVCLEDSGVLPEYLYYYLLFAEEELQNRAYVTVGSRIGMEQLRELIIPIPPEEKQRLWVGSLKRLEAFLWKKEDILELLQKVREDKLLKEAKLREKPESAAQRLAQLEALSQELLETGNRFFRAVLFTLFYQADSEKEQYYYSGEKRYAEEDPFARLNETAAGLIQKMSAFQQALYLQFMREKEPAAIHDVLKRMKKGKPRFADYHIQDALASVEMFRQLGLMTEPVQRKLYYGGRQEEENEVRGDDGRPLFIELWSCNYRGVSR